MVNRAGVRRDRRGLRAGVAAALAVVSVAAATLPAAANPVKTCADIFGYVTDAYGAPIAGAQVTARNAASTSAAPCAEAVLTDGQGRYITKVDVMWSTVAVAATRPGFARAEATATTSEVIGGGVPTLQMRYVMQATASPAWVNSGRTVNLTATTSAPPPPAGAGYVCEWGLGHGDDPQVLTRSTAVLKTDGTPLQGAVQVVADVNRFLARLADGTVMAWGWNSYQSSLGVPNPGDVPPTPVTGLGGSGVLTQVRALAVGDHHTLALLEDGTVAAWGANYVSQLGDPTWGASYIPRRVPSIDGPGPLTDVVAVAAGGDQSLALLADGRVVRWGRVNDGMNYPNHVSGPELVRDSAGRHIDAAIDIAAGDLHAVTARSDGTVFAWGVNTSGQLGHPGVAGSYAALPVAGMHGAGELTGVVRISAGARHTLALLRDGGVASWGANGDGELGDGAATPAPGGAPRGVVGERGGMLANVASIAAGGAHSFAILQNGVVLAWGRNLSYELGDGTKKSSASPIRPLGGAAAGVLVGVTSLDGHYHYSVAVRSGPCADNGAPVRVVAQLGTGPSAAQVALTLGPTDAQGLTTWTGNVTASGGDGLRTLRVCAVDKLFQGNCDAAAVPGYPQIVSTTAHASYGVDNTPPRVTGSTPPPYGAVPSLASVCITLIDAGSGVDARTVRMTVDGAPVERTFTGSQACVAKATVPPAGVHRLDLQASDSAGNSTTYALVFTNLALTATAAVATVPDAVVWARPNGELAPDKVQFTDLVANVQGFELTANASTRVGYGDFTRPISYPSDAEHSYVRFEDEFGNLSARYPIPPIGTVETKHTAAVLAPSASELTAAIPPSTVALGTLTVPIPVEQRALVKKAHLHIGPVELGAPRTATGGAAFSQSLTGSVPVAGALASCLEWHPQGPTDVGCRVDEAPDYSIFVNGKKIPSFIPRPVNPAPPDQRWGTLPTCKGCVDPRFPDESGSPSPTMTFIGEQHSGSLILRCPRVVLGVPTNLCDNSSDDAPANGFLAARMNDAVYGDPAARFALWRQDDVTADPAGDKCPNGARPVLGPDGRSGGARASLHRVVANTEPTDSAGEPLAAGTYRAYHSIGSSPPVVRLVDADDGGAGPTEATNGNVIADGADYGPPQFSDEVLGFAISVAHNWLRAPLDGHYYVLANKAVDVEGHSTEAPGSTANIWQRDGTAVASSSPTEGSVALVHATLMRSAAPGGGYGFAAELLFQGVITYACS